MEGMVNTRSSPGATLTHCTYLRQQWRVNNTKLETCQGNPPQSGLHDLGVCRHNRHKRSFSRAIVSIQENRKRASEVRSHGLKSKACFAAAERSAITREASASSKASTQHVRTLNGVANPHDDGRDNELTTQALSETNA